MEDNLENSQKHLDSSSQSGAGGKQAAQEYESKWKKVLADFENYKKDEAKKFSVFAKFSKIEALRDLLPVFDMLERAVHEIPQDIKSYKWVDGISLIYEEFLSILAKNGFKKIETNSKSFDPKYHEAVGRIDGVGDDVVEDIRSGFVTADDFVIRAVQVKIGKKK